jgi:hypothetical protein
LAAKTWRVITSAIAVAVVPAAKAGDPAMMALARRPRPRRGPAVKVVRMSARRYSEVTNKVAITITRRSATIVPFTMLAPDRWVAASSPPTSGAMSPEPLTVNVSADRCCQAEG